MSLPRPKPDPARPSSPGTARSCMLSVFIVVNMAVAGWILASSVMPRAAPAADVAAATPPNACADAVERVQAYQAPGQGEPLTDVIAANVAAEGLRRPVAIVGWEPPRVWRGDCEVGLQLSIGNELKTLRWAVRTDTGRVEALNDLAKQMSGW
jgi:hypothetical protein